MADNVINNATKVTQSIRRQRRMEGAEINKSLLALKVEYGRVGYSYQDYLSLYVSQREARFNIPSFFVCVCDWGISLPPCALLSARLICYGVSQECIRALDGNR